MKKKRLTLSTSCRVKRQISRESARDASMNFWIKQITDRACAQTRVLTEILQRDTKDHPQRYWIVIE